MVRYNGRHVDEIEVNFGSRRFDVSGCRCYEDVVEEVRRYICDEVTAAVEATISEVRFEDGGSATPCEENWFDVLESDNRRPSATRATRLSGRRGFR